MKHVAFQLVNIVTHILSMASLRKSLKYHTVCPVFFPLCVAPYLCTVVEIQKLFFVYLYLWFAINLRNIYQVYIHKYMSIFFPFD